jgi:hypothetical protein
MPAILQEFAATMAYSGVPLLVAAFFVTLVAANSNANSSNVVLNTIRYGTFSLEPFAIPDLNFRGPGITVTPSNQGQFNLPVTSAPSPPPSPASTSSTSSSAAEPVVPLRRSGGAKVPFPPQLQRGANASLQQLSANGAAAAQVGAKRLCGSKLKCALRL